jgi:lysophospholipase L1-like esterase
VPAEIHYLALGDSITAGGYAGDGAFVVKYNSHLADDLDTVSTLNNLGVSGWTSADLLDAVLYDQAYRDAIAGADVITLFIGMNDFFQAALVYRSGACGGPNGLGCLTFAAVDYADNLASIIAEVRALQSGDDVVVRLGELFYPADGVPAEQPEYAVFHPTIVAMNDVVHALAVANGYRVAPLYDAINADDAARDPVASELLIGDGIHPSAFGFDLIASAFRSLGYAPLVDDAGAPWVIDGDGDGCPNASELGANERLGGRRDPYNPWDYFNPGQDGANRIDDILAVARSYGHDSGDPLYSVNYDRTMLDGAHPWQFGPPDGSIRPFDITAAILSFGHDCP